MTITLDVLEPSICGRPTGVLGVNPNGTWPYTYMWSDGQTEQVIGGLAAGTYSVTVTDALGESATGSATVPGLTSYPAGYLNADQVPMSYCAGEMPRVAVWHGVNNGQSPPPEGHYGPMPYSFEHPDLVDVVSYTTACEQTNVDWYQLLVFDAPAGQGYTVDYQDGDGCPGQLDVYLKLPMEWPSIQVGNVTGTCSNGAAGTLTVNVGPQPQNNSHTFMIYARPVNDFTTCPSYGGLPSTLIDQPETEFGTTRTITGLAAGDHWLVWTTDPLSLQTNNFSQWEACKDSVLFTVPVISTDCGIVNGSLFVDVSGNCLPGSGEPRVPYGVIEITPGPYYVTTNFNGTFTIPLPAGDYIFNDLHPLLDQSCDGAITVANTGNQTKNVGCAPLGVMDVQVGIGSDIPRPGFQPFVSASVVNLTPDPSGVLTITMIVDPLLSIVSTEPTATSVVGNTITWDLPQAPNAWGTVYARALVQVPADPGLIGTSVSHSVSVSTANVDADLSNNSASVTQTIQGSYDPNDKTATTSTGNTSIWTIDEDEWIDYLIRFQNTGTDTAFGVVITDTLPATLDPSSIQWGHASHPHVSYLQGAGVLRFVFPDILLPDSNVNEAASHGFISFRIRPRQPVLPGTVIQNVANIYFDYNPPVITDPSVLVAEFSVGVSEQRASELFLFPNPVKDQLTLTSDRQMVGIKLLSVDGHMVHQGPATGTQHVLNLGQLSAGTYIVDVSLEDGVHLRSYFVKE